MLNKIFFLTENGVVFKHNQYMPRETAIYSQTQTEEKCLQIHVLFNLVLHI